MIRLGGGWILHLIILATLNFYSPGYPVPPVIHGTAAGAMIFTPERIDGPQVTQELLATVVQNMDFSSFLLFGYAKRPEILWTVGIKGMEQKGMWRWMLYFGSKGKR